MKNSRPQVPNKQINPHQDQMSWTKDATREAIVARISDPENLRFMWLRNPYSRLLSGFLDKGVGGNVNENYNIRMDNYGAPFEPTPGEFLRFIKALLSMRADGAHIDEHFRPQAEQCGLQHGMQYDFHLKVEDIHVWYPDLIALFGLEDTVSSGWSFLVSPPPPPPPPPPPILSNLCLGMILPCIHQLRARTTRRENNAVAFDHASSPLLTPCIQPGRF